MIEVKDIDRNIVARYLGMKPEDINDVMSGLIDEAEELVKKDAEIGYVCGIYDIVKKEGGIGFDEVSIVLPGEDIAKLLDGCEKGVLMCATLSGYIDTRIRTLQIKNMPLALVYDACASVAIDQVCDDVQKYIRERLPEYVQTMRFSPGYGDLPISIQREFLDCVEANKRCGVSLTEGGMLTPTKTVTAVFGLKTFEEYIKSMGDINLRTDVLGNESDMGKTIPEEGQFTAIIPEKGGCGDESVCSKCKAAAKCSMANKNVKDSLEEQK